MVQPAHGYVKNSDRMADSYSMSRRTFKWPMKLFFHVLDLTVLNSWILLSSCGLNIPTEISGSFWWGISMKKLERAKITPPPDWLEDQVRPWQMCNLRVAITNTGQRNHPPNSTAVCSSRGQRKGTVCKCARCDMGLCMVPCLAEYHTKVNL